MSEITPVAQQVNTVAQHLMNEKFTRQLQLALPRAGITGERLARIAFTEVRRNPRLSECTIESLLGSVMQCAQYGLEPGPAGLSWLIPRRRKGTWEVNFQLGYKGLVQLLWRSGNVSWINAQVVHEADEFIYCLGAPPSVTFRPSDLEDRGPVTHVWAAIGTTTGGNTLEVWTQRDVEKHRKRFVKAGPGTPWDTDWDSMAKKTLLIQAAKFAPISVEAQSAITIDERANLGMAQEIDVTPPAAETPQVGAGAAEASETSTEKGEAA